MLPQDDARRLARTIFSAEDLAARYGARIDPAVLVLAAEISSATGETEPPKQLAGDHVEHELIDASTAADLLQCSSRNVRDLATRGRIPGQKIAGRWQFNRDDIEVLRDWR